MDDLILRSDLLVTPRQAGLLCGVDTDTIYAWVGRGILPVQRNYPHSRRYLLNLVDLARAEQCARKGSGPRSPWRDLSASWELENEPECDAVQIIRACAEHAELTPLAARPAIVYYLRLGAHIKIGTTVNLVDRLRGMPHDEVLATEPGGREVEQERHRRFAEYRLAGRKDRGREWFYAGPLLKQHLVSLDASLAPRIASL